MDVMPVSSMTRSTSASSFPRATPLSSPAKRRYSRGVISGYTGGISGRYPICRLASSGSRSISCPAIRTVPDVADRYPVMIFMVVDLPAPLGPKNP